MAVVIRILLLCVLCAHAFGQERVDLYRSELLVPNQSQAERNRAAEEGLSEVLVRASGQPQILENPQVADALDRAADFLVEWRYENTDEELEKGDRQVPAWRLVLRYSGNAVENLLRELRLPIWPANRPSMLTWLVVDSDEGRTRVSAGDTPDMMKMVESAAQRRGIPLLKPLMDLEDQVALPSARLWGMDEQLIREASERYSPDSILAGRLTETSRGQWRAVWLLIHRDQATMLDGKGSALEDVIAEGVDQVANHFFELYGITPSDASSEALLVQVDGIGDFADYARFQDYLQRLAVVRHYDLAAVQGDSMLLYVDLQGGVGQLRDALALDRRLQPHSDQVDNSVPPGSPTNPLRYRWR